MLAPGPGALLVATPLLLDPNFARSVVLVLRHDDDGTFGVVLDRPTTIPVGDFLPDWHDVASLPPVVFHGGPVEPEVGIGVSVRDGAVTMVDLTAPPEDESGVRIFAGYAGWGTGQLGDEIEEHAWFVVASRPSDLTAPDPAALWSDVLRRQPFELSIYADFPPDPRLN